MSEARVLDASITRLLQRNLELAEELASDMREALGLPRERSASEALLDFAAECDAVAKRREPGWPGWQNAARLARQHAYRHAAAAAGPEPAPEDTEDAEARPEAPGEPWLEQIVRGKA